MSKSISRVCVKSGIRGLRFFGSVVLLLGGALAFAGEAPKIAVLQFQNRSGSTSYWHATKHHDTGWDLAERVLAGLAESGKFQGVEQERLEGALNQSSWKGDRLAAADEAKLHNELGAQYILYGTVTHWGVERTRNQVGVLGNVINTASAPEATVTLSLRLVDAGTSKILKTYLARGSAEGIADVSIQGDDSVTVKGSGESPVLEQAEARAIDRAVEELTGSASNASSARNHGSEAGHDEAEETRSAEATGGGGEITINDNMHNRTFDCRGRSVSVAGNYNNVILRGECSRLTVDGTGNNVTLESVGAITTMGNNNNVTWARGLRGQNPRISNPGNNNKIRK